MAYAWWALQSAFPEKLPAVMEEEPVPAGGGQPANFTILTMAMIAALGGVLLFVVWRLLIPGLAAFALSAILVLFSGWRPARPEPWGSSDRRWLLVVLIAAAALRLPFVGDHFTGLQLDEANSIVDSAGILRGEVRSPFRTVWGGNPSFTHYPLALFQMLFGKEVWVARGLAALTSLVAIGYFHRWVRFFVSPSAAAVTSLLFVFSWWHLLYALSPFHNIFQLAIELAAFYHLEKTLRRGRRGDAWWTGVLAAAAVMSYISGRLVPILLFGVAVFAWIRCRCMALWKTALLGALGFLWLFGPFILFIRENPHEFLARGKELNLFAEMGKRSPSEARNLLVGKVRNTLLCTNWPNEGEVDPRFNVPGNPFLDPAAGWLFVLGMAALARGPTRRFAVTAFAGIGVGYAANILSWWHFMPFHLNGHRFFFVLPFLFLAVAAGVALVLESMKAWGRPGGVLPSRPAFLVVLLVSLFWNVRVYFFGFRSNDLCVLYQSFPHLKICELYRQYERSHQLFIDWRLYQSIHRVGTGDRLMGSVMQDQMEPLKWTGDRNAMFFLSTEVGSRAEDVKRTFPHAYWLRPPAAWGRLFVEIAVVPASQLRGWNGRFFPEAKWER